jgi:hypothetical protein
MGAGPRLALVVGLSLWLGCGGAQPAAAPDAAADAGLDGGDAAEGRACTGLPVPCFSGGDEITYALCDDGAWKCPPGYSTENGIGCGPAPAGPPCECQMGLWKCNDAVVPPP